MPINDLKTPSASRTRAHLAHRLSAFYAGPLFWRRVDDVGGVGGPTMETVCADGDAQGAVEQGRKAATKRRSRALDTLLRGQLRLSEVARQADPRLGMCEPVFTLDASSPIQGAS